MRKVSAICITILTTAMLLTACQATPEQPVIVQKDMQQMIEKANAAEGTEDDGSLRERLRISDRYCTDFSGYNGDLTVHADAVVIVPDAEALSSIRVGKRFFTQEDADRMIKVLLKGETLYNVDSEAHEGGNRGKACYILWDARRFRAHTYGRRKSGGQGKAAAGYRIL